MEDLVEAPATPPVMTSYRHDPMWADLGIPVLTEQEMRVDEVRRRIDSSRNAAILRGQARRQAAAEQQQRDDDRWQYDAADDFLQPPTDDEIAAAASLTLESVIATTAATCGHANVTPHTIMAAAAAAFSAALERVANSSSSSTAPPNSPPSSATVAAAADEAIATAKARIAAKPFRPTCKYDGPADGMVFRTGPDGLGYYPDAAAATRAQLHRELFPMAGITPMTLDLRTLLGYNDHSGQHAEPEPQVDVAENPGRDCPLVGPNPRRTQSRGKRRSPPNATATWRKTRMTRSGRTTTR